MAGGVLWKSIKKFRPNKPGKAEIRNLRGVMLRAREEGCHALAFSRDRDAKNNKKREQVIHLGIQQLRDTYPDGPQVIGGMAIEKLESWLIAMMGKNGSEQHRRPENLLAESEVRTTAEMFKLVESAEFENLPCDAKSLNAWISEAKKIMTGPTD